MNDKNTKCGCGGNAGPRDARNTNPRDIRGTVREEYGKIARQGASEPGAHSCCGGPSPDSVAASIGYSGAELAGLPDGANMGLSCGNPTAIASLKPGEVILDLGAGGGFDVFIAARKVGPEGRAIGVDMTPGMIEKARRNAESFAKTTGLANVEFRLGEIEHLPVADGSVDALISNCVINLSPDKPQVWREIARVLKPGGRVAVSDLALLKPLPDAVRASVRALVGCVAGAVLVEETRAMMQAAGLVDIRLESKSEYMNSMSEWSDPLYREIAEKLPSGTKPGDFVTSLNITARKPGK
ncbi:MAG: arsenite methyltransferase [Chitinivibrionia bacterium]|nr:arsenite methyltransferase [Chitinivibrionia bacterium]